MQYFKDFGNLFYKFGNEVDPVIFEDISRYVDIIDQIKDDLTFLNVHTIQEGFRPDQVSIQLYGNPLYYWTFYLLNDDLREQGWPLINHELQEYIKKIFPNTTITTRNTISDKFKVGQTVTGNTSGASGEIIRRDLSLGQIVVRGSVSFSTGGEVMNSTNSSGTVETITSVSSSNEYQAAAYYINSSNQIVDIDPHTGPGAQITEQTNENVYYNVNENLRNIKVIRPSQISNIVSGFKEALKS
tara:strand:- start:1912 stop:2640 length:729 start_codon:yes stop_codon:yes gene_type:complete